MKPSSGLFLGEFAMVSVPNLWVQVFSLLMLFVLSFSEAGLELNKFPNFEGN